MKSRQVASDELVLCYGLRHLGDTRELLILKVKGNNFYAFPVYAKKPDGHVDVHNSWHESGVFHPVFRIHTEQGQPSPVRRVYIPTLDGKSRSMQEGLPIAEDIRRIRPSELKGIGLLMHSCLLLHQFQELSPIGTHEGESVILDAERENFADDFIAANVYLVEPGAENLIPKFPYTAARLLNLNKRTTPWLAVELFQQSAHASWQSQALREWERQMQLCSDASGLSNQLKKVTTLP